MPLRIIFSAIESPSSSSREIAPLLDGGSFGVGGEPLGREKHTMIIIALNRTSEFVDFWSTHWVLSPAFRLKG
jgi:hypothetical protein